MLRAVFETALRAVLISSLIRINSGPNILRSRFFTASYYGSLTVLYQVLLPAAGPDSRMTAGGLAHAGLRAPMRSIARPTDRTWSDCLMDRINVNALAGESRPHHLHENLTHVTSHK